MNSVGCTRCGEVVTESEGYMAASGVICTSCQTDIEVSETARKGWLSFENILVLMLVGGNFTFTLSIGGIDYGKFIISVLALLGAAYTLSLALKTPEEPTWLRWGRPGMLLAVGLLNLAAALFVVL